ncbi:MAG: hypothetical protein IT423_17750 [Pirellulaceae bacterium]|nr:hypothetical protein [Pirellulaceae bacterium]
MSLSLPSSNAESQSIVWREILRNGLGDREYEQALESLVHRQIGGFIGAIIGGLNLAAAVLGFWLAMLVALIASRLGNNILLAMSKENALASQAIERFDERLTQGAGLAVLTCLIACGLGALIGASSPWPKVFAYCKLGFKLLVQLPLLTLPVWFYCLIPLMIFTSIGVQVANARELVSEPLTFQGTWAVVYWTFSVIAIGVAYALWHDMHKTEIAGGDWISNARQLAFWWVGRPHYLQLEKALQRVGDEQFISLANCVALSKPEKLVPATLHTALASRDWTERFVARHNLIRLGGLAVEGLETNWNKNVASALMKQISAETTRLHAHQRSLCRTCWAVVKKQKTQVAGKSFGYYGCRVCRQGHSVTNLQRYLVGVLDTNSSEASVYEGPDLVWNYHKLHLLADLDRFEVRHACDEDVERFLIDVSESLDEGQRKQCKSAKFVIRAPGITQNTVRMAKKIFQSVEV